MIRSLRIVAELTDSFLGSLKIDVATEYGCSLPGHDCCDRCSIAPSVSHRADACKEDHLATQIKKRHAFLITSQVHLFYHLLMKLEGMTLGVTG